MASTDRFGFEWDKYSNLDSNYEKQFKNWTHPLGLDDFKDKKVLDAGCGMGRNSYWPLKWGAEEVVAFDYDKRSVEAAKKNLSKFNNAHIVYRSIYDIEWQNKFDIAFSIGVIHHLKDPKKATKKLLDSTKEGGTLLFWLYSYEGYKWLVKYINPIRKNFTSKLPLPLVHFLSYFLSIPLWVFVKIFRGPSDYLKQLSTFKFWHLHSIVFDQLIPEVANYWKKEDVEELFQGLNFKELKIAPPPNNCGWVVIVKK